MSRSTRKTPMRGVTTATSDKFFKTKEHRRERRAVRVALEVGHELPLSKGFGDPWNGHKDGKLWWGNSWPEVYRK